MIARILLAGVVIFAITLGYQFAVPPVKNSMLEGKMREVATNRAGKSERSVKSEIMAYIREKEIPLDDAEVILTSDNQKISLAARYTVDVEVLGYVHTYEFYPASNEQARLERHYRRMGRSTR